MRSAVVVPFCMEVLDGARVLGVFVERMIIALLFA